MTAFWAARREAIGSIRAAFDLNTVALLRRNGAGWHVEASAGKARLQYPGRGRLQPRAHGRSRGRPQGSRSVRGAFSAGPRVMTPTGGQLSTPARQEGLSSIGTHRCAAAMTLGCGRPECVPNWMSARLRRLDLSASAAQIFGDPAWQDTESQPASTSRFVISWPPSARQYPPFGTPRTMTVRPVADIQNRLFWRVRALSPLRCQGRVGLDRGGFPRASRRGKCLFRINIGSADGFTAVLIGAGRVRVKSSRVRAGGWRGLPRLRCGVRGPCGPAGGVG